MNRIATHQYEIASFLVNPQGRLGLYALLNILQDAAWKHAQELGHGDKENNEKKVFWVVTRQNLVMNKWASWGDKLQIKTWVRPPDGAFAVRDWEIYQDGKKIGESTASWALMDLATRKPSRAGLEALRDQGRPDGADDYCYFFRQSKN